MKKVTDIFWCVVAAAAVVGLMWFDFYVWQLKHPQAPTWTFFFGH